MAYPIFSRRRSQCLDGIWNFRFLADRELVPLTAFELPKEPIFDERTVVPGCFDACVPHAGKRGIGLYRRSVTLTKDGPCLLRCGGFLLAAKIFLDGREIGYTDLPYSGVEFRFDASAGTHEIVIAVDNRPAATPLVLNYYDFYLYGGIPRSLTLDELPENVAFQRCRVRTLDLAAGRIALDITFQTAPDGALPVEIAINDGAFAPYTLSVRDCAASLELALPDPVPWTCAAPHLYTVTLRTASDAVSERFGLRTVEAKAGRILLNGEPVRLLGYNRHESHPDFGPALPRATMLQDLNILKDLNCNFIRGSHYPQDPEFLDLCDASGFLVWEESLAWGNQEAQLADPIFRAKQLEQTERMIRNSCNHPSVILWGFLNECASDHEEAVPLIESLAAAIRAYDSTRPITFASNRLDHDLCLHLVDVVSFNLYPGWYGVEQNETDPEWRIPARLKDFEAFLSRPAIIEKPFIISEIGAGALYGCRDRLKQLWSEDYQALYLKTVCDCVEQNPRIAGLALWMYCDSRTYCAGQSRPRGFNNKGTLDEYRRPKLAYEIVKEAFAGLRGG